MLVRRLIAAKYSVTALDALLYGSESLRGLREKSRFKLIESDFRDVGTVVESMHGIDGVVHLGAIVGDEACALDERLTQDVNVAGTGMLANVARSMGARRFVFASTCSVYGASDHLLDERSEPKPASLYARSKVASEQHVLRLADDRFAPTVLRLGTIFGLSPRPRFDLALNHLTARAMTEKTITISGGGQWRPFVHVGDAANAIVATLESPRDAVGGEILNVGSDSENYRLEQVGALIKGAVPDVDVVTDRTNPDRRDYRVSFAKFRERVGPMHVTSVLDGIREIGQAIADGVIGNFRDPKFNNHQTLANDGMAGLARLHASESWDGAAIERHIAGSAGKRRAAPRRRASVRRLDAPGESPA